MFHKYGRDVMNFIHDSSFFKSGINKSDGLILKSLNTFQLVGTHWTTDKPPVYHSIDVFFKVVEGKTMLSSLGLEALFGDGSTAITFSLIIGFSKLVITKDGLICF